MNIKLPYLPFKFDSPEGRMEVTVRLGLASETTTSKQRYIAGLSFIEAGPRALTRIPLAVKSSTYGEAMRLLTEGFKISPESHEEHSVEFRVLNALVATKGVVDLDM